MLNGTVLPRLTRIDTPYPVRCTQIACGRKHILCLTENNFVLSWGTGYFGQLGHGDDSNCISPRIVNGLDPRRIGSKPVKVACGGSHSAALTNTGMIFMWGLNKSGQTGTASKLDSVIDPTPVDGSDVQGGTLVARDVVCGRSHSAAVTADGRLFTWGAGVQTCLHI